MSRFNLINLILSVVVITLAVFIYFSEEKDFRLDRVTDIDLDSITEIKIQHNRNTTTLIKQDNNWQVTQPVSIAANNFRISSILKLIHAPIHNEYRVSKINTGKFGLDNPNTSIQFVTDSTSYIINFGIINPATNLRYIQLNNSVYTIEDVYYPLISSHFGTLVSLSLLPEQSTIEKLVLANQTLSKDASGLWQSNIDISADNIIKTIDNWQRSQAFGIHEYLKREHLGDIYIYIDGKEKPVTYQITDNDPWLILARPELGLEYHLDIEKFDTLIAPE